jgi:hypothetical protein
MHVWEVLRGNRNAVPKLAAAELEAVDCCLEAATVLRCGA